MKSCLRTPVNAYDDLFTCLQALIVALSAGSWVVNIDLPLACAASVVGQRTRFLAQMGYVNLPRRPLESGITLHRPDREDDAVELGLWLWIEPAGRIGCGSRLQSSAAEECRACSDVQAFAEWACAWGALAVLLCCLPPTKMMLLRSAPLDAVAAVFVASIRLALTAA